MAFIEFHTNGVVLKEENIVDQWQGFIPQAQGSAEKIFAETERRINDANIPDIKVIRKELIEGRKSSVCLLVYGAKPFDKFCTFIIARDYGKNLLVSRYVTCSERDIKMVFRLYDLFAKEEFGAYISTIHAALLDAVKQIAVEFKHDFSKMNTKSRGILNIS